MDEGETNDWINDLRSPHPFRKHQQQALDALDKAISAGHNHAWVVLPPGAGKTLVGLETVRRLNQKAIVFGPNTAIQSQWVSGWNSFLPDSARRSNATARTTRDLDGFFTALTYQSLATFNADSEVDEEGDEQPLLARLHPNGQAFVEAMKRAGPLTLVLDECHHLLEVWGRLLQELLDELPEAFVIGLTATPPDALTPEQTELVDDLFGETVYSVSIPAVVREGDLAPFGEMAWLTTPTPVETKWLAEQADRFHELVHQLTDPAFGSISFFEWLDQRFVVPVGQTLTWHRLSKDEPELSGAALRMHHAGYLRLPHGARMLEEHRHPPTADDWVRLIDDWMRRHLAESDRPEDEAVVGAVRRTLPSVGYQWTRRGIRKGRSPVDRVLARSSAKTHALVQIVGLEHRNLGTRLRMLVLCDHEYASAILPADLSGVLSQQAGSARLALESLIEDPMTRELHPMLVSGSTVAGAPETLRRFLDFVADSDPDLAEQLVVAWPDAEVTQIHGPWKSRQWVGHVTRFFEQGHCQVLVGTRGLLGEGWDARSITGLVDLTAATTATSVVQTRGRALRTDPHWREKVALNWTVVCVAEDHPKGQNDWERFVRKHQGFFGVDEEGDVVDGVAHVDPLFSPYHPPTADSFDRVNARMLVRSERRPEIADRWQVGEPYADSVVHTVRLLPATREAVGTTQQPAPIVMSRHGLEPRAGQTRPWKPHPAVALSLLVTVAAIVLGAGALIATAATVATALAIQTGVATARGRGLARRAAQPPSIEQVACAVADGLHAADRSPVGAEAVQVEIDEDGEYRCALGGVAPEVSQRFATALDEVVSPMASPRYVLPRWVLEPAAATGPLAGLKAAVGALRPTGEVWHSVPTVLGTHARHAQAFAEAWDTWVGGGEALYTGSPEGEGVLATHRGSDPFAVTTVLRVHWR